jgi:cobalt import ATP-binding protein cbiO 1
MSIKVENINYIYSEGTAFENYALKDINFEISDGSFVGIIGHTGSGKSTLIQQLNGLIKASTGKIYYKGQNIYDENYKLKEHRQKVGLVFQYPEHQLFEIDVLSDVCFGPLNQGLSKEEAIERAKSALTLVGLDESFYKKSPFELSGGQKRRVAIAGVLAMNPEVLILDEPTAGLDPKGREEILGKISELRKSRNITIILVSHSMEDVAKYADKILVLSKGELVLNGTPKEVFRHIDLLESIGLRAPEVSYIIRELREKGFEINEDISTIEEARDAILALVRRKNND